MRSLPFTRSVVCTAIARELRVLSETAASSVLSASVSASILLAVNC